MADSKSPYLPIVLGLSEDALKGRASDFRGDEDLDEATRTRIFERDDHTCRYCGFRSEKYQRINAIDGRWANPADQNLATACIFCNQCFYLDQVSDMRSGVLIWLPEMTQAALNHLMRAIYVARITQGPVADFARQSLDTLMARRDQAKARVQTDDPAILAMVLSEYIDSKFYAQRRQKLDGVRLLPLDRRVIKEGDLEFNQFPQILAYWRSKKGPFGDFMPDVWVEKYRQFVSSAA